MEDDDDDQAVSVQSNVDAMLSSYDSPTERATICKLTLNDLEAMLEAIRTRRLQQVQKLEALARVKADETHLANYMRYERMVKQVRKAIDKCVEAEEKAESVLHKLRIMVMTIEMEVSEDA